MMRFAVTLLTGLMLSAVAGADWPSDRELLDQAAADPPTPRTQRPADATPPAAEPSTDTGRLDDAERRARIDANLALAKLNLVQGRKLLRTDKPTAAARKAQQALVLLRQVPTTAQVEEYELQAEGILARARRAGVDVAGLRRDARDEAPLLPGDAELDREVQGAARVARQFEGSSRPDVDHSGDPRRLRERALRQSATDRYAYRPGGTIIDIDAVLAADRQRTYYEGVLRDAYKADEVRLLINADEARLVPDGVVSYPNDWPERVARRAKYADGVIARSPSWHDDQGREWYVAVYDIRDLIYVPPDFMPHFGFGPHDLRDTLDRRALRDHSFIFRGGPRELAEGLPLLRYFGGVHPLALRGPKYSPEKQAEIVNMIRTFVGGEVESGPMLPAAP